MAVLSSQLVQNDVFLYTFGSSDGIQNGVECSQAERILVRDGEAVRSLANIANHQIVGTA